MRQLAFILLTTLTLGLSNMVLAWENTPSASESGKIVVYREKSRIAASFMVYANADALGRVKQGRAIAAQLPAGTYTISTNVSGSETLEVVIKAGETLYIDSDIVKANGGKYQTVLNPVTEQVALTSVSSVSDVI